MTERVAMSDDFRNESIIWTPAYVLASAANFDESSGELLLDAELDCVVRPFSWPEGNFRNAVLVFTDLPSAEDYLARAKPEEKGGNPRPVELPTDRHLARFLHWVRWQRLIDYAAFDMLPPSRLARPILIDEIVGAYLSRPDTQGQE